MRTKKDFPKDSKGRTILANAEDMREWVELGFDEQRRNRSADIPFPQDVIDLRECALYTSNDARGQVPGMRVRWQVGIWQQLPCMYTNRQRVDANASAFFVTPTGFNNVA